MEKNYRINDDYYKHVTIMVWIYLYICITNDLKGRDRLFFLFF